MTRPRVVLYNPRAVFHTMPLALVAIASSLDREQLEVVIVDGRLERDAERRLVELAADAVCVGVSVLTGAPIRDALAASRAVKAAHPAVPIVWGGWHPSLFPHDCLAEPSVDVVVTGQGELTFRALVCRFRAGEPAAGCPGTLTRGADGPVAGPPRPLADLNQLPPHDYSLLPLERYFALKRRRQLDYVSSQGCRFRCAFCADPAVYARGWTGLAPERVASELAALQAQHRIEEVAFQDETFFTQPGRVDALSEELLRHELAVAWTATLRADQACRLGPALFAKAVRSGLRRVMIGVESGSQATLDRLQKDMRLEQVETAAELCLRHGVGAIFNFIVGFPDEPPESIAATLALAKRLRGMSPDFETPIFCYRPYPGNPLAESVAARGYELPRGLEAWADFDYVGGRGPWLSEETFERVERFGFYARHAFGRGAWRWPLRLAARWRCARDVYAWPFEKVVVEGLRPPRPVS